MEDFIRIEAPSFELAATVDGVKRTLVLGAVPNPETGETVGSTSLFEGRAGWLRGVRTFEAAIPRLEVHGQVFAGVTFAFPKGTPGG